MNKQLEDVMLDIDLFLSKKDEISRENQRQLLISIFQKHLVLTTSDVSLNYFDFQKVRSDSMNMYSTQKLDLKFGKNELREPEAIQLLLLESFIGLLNGKGALKRLPKFNKE